MGNKTIDISKAPPLESSGEIDISKAPSFDGEKKNSLPQQSTSLVEPSIPSAEIAPPTNGGGNDNKPYSYSFDEIKTPEVNLPAASTYGASTEGRPQIELPKTVAEVKKAGGTPTFNNYLASAGKGTAEYIGKHLQQTLQGTEELAKGVKHGGLEGALDVIKGGANTAFGVLSFTPVGAAFNVATEAIVPESINKWLFSPATEIAEKAGYKPKEGLGKKALETGDIVLSLLAMHKSGKLAGKAIGEEDFGVPAEDINKASSDALKSKIENKEPLNADEAKQVTDIVNSATPGDLKQALDDNTDKLHPEHHFEDKVVNVVEKLKEDKDVVKDIAKLEGVDKSTFDNVVNTAKDAQHITDDQAKDLKKSFEDVETAKELIPEEHKNNAKVVSLMVDKNELLNAKKSTDKVFHEPIDKQIEVIDGKIKSALGMPKEEKVVAKEGKAVEKPEPKELSPIETKPSPEDIEKREEFVTEHISDLENSGEMSKDISREQYSNYFRNLYDRKYVNKSSNESGRITTTTGTKASAEENGGESQNSGGQGILGESVQGGGDGRAEINPKGSVNAGEPARVSVTHEAIEQRRKEAGLPPIEKLPTDIKKDFTEAADEFKGTHKDLAKKIADSDKTLSSRKDTYVLGLGRVEMLKQAKEIRQKITEAADSNDLEKVDELKGDLKTIEDNLDVNETAIKHASSEAGKALQSFQTAFAEDLSLENTLLQARSIAKEGKLTDEQIQKFAEISSRLEEAQKKLSEHEEKIAKMESQKAIDDLAVEEKLKKGIEEGVAKKKFTIKAKAVADEFRKLKTKPPTFTDANGNPIQVFTAGITWNDIIEVGAKAIEKTGEIADGVKAMVDHVKEQDWYTKLSDKDKEAFEGQLKGHFESVNQPKEEIMGSAGISGAVKELIRQGITTESEIVSKLKEDNPHMTDRQIRDEISGYGRSTKLNQDPVEIKYREVKRVAGLISKLEDIEEGKPPMKKITGQAERTQEEIDLRNQINEGMQKLTGEKEKKVVTDEERWKNNLERYKTRLKNELTSLEKKREVRDYEIKKRIVTPLDKEGEELKMKVNKEKILRQMELTKIELENRSKLQKVYDASVEVANLPRTLMSSMDFSAPLRQGLVATVAHPKIALAAGLEMFKQAGSQARFDKWFHDVKEDPRYTEAKKSGLHIADPHDPRLTVKEEAFMNNLAQKIPFIGSLIKGSERAYVGYLNKLRWDVYNQLAEQMFVNGENYISHPKLYKGLADYINNSTGRGKIGALEAAAPVLNTVLFSPRLIASRLNAINPIYYAKLPKPVRIQALKDMGKLLLAGGTVLGLAKLNGADVESDPRSSDFGKIRFGNTRYDIWGGHQQYIRVLAQVLSGKTKSNGKIYELGKNKAFGRTRGDVLLSFARGKLAPVPSMGADILSGRTVTGDEVTLKDELKSHLLPLIYSDLNEAMKDKGAKALFTVGLPSTFGVGVSTYSPKKKMAKYKLQTSQ